MDDDLKRLIESTAAETHRIADEMQRIGVETAGNTAETRRLADEMQRIGAETANNTVEIRQLGDEMRRIAAETRRHFDIVAEGMRGNDAIALEGVTMCNQRIDRLVVDMKQEFAETKSMIRFAYSDLDRRLRRLE